MIWFSINLFYPYITGLDTNRPSKKRNTHHANNLPKKKEQVVRLKLDQKMLSVTMKIIQNVVEFFKEGIFTD